MSAGSIPAPEWAIEGPNERPGMLPHIIFISNLKTLIDIIYTDCKVNVVILVDEKGFIYKKIKSQYHRLCVIRN